MSESNNQSLVKSLYESFARGDLDAVFSKLADDVMWEGPASAELPYSGNHRGKPAVKDFFAGVGQVDISLFEMAEYLSAGNSVVVIGRWGGKVRKTGKTFESKVVMVWEIENGKVKRFRDFEDTAETAAAFRK